MGQFSDNPPWWKTAPIKRPIKRSMKSVKGGFQTGHFRKDPAFQGSARQSFSKFRALGSAIWRVRQDTLAEPVRVRQRNMTATLGSARSTLSKILAFRKIILLNLLWGVHLCFLTNGGSSFEGEREFPHPPFTSILQEASPFQDLSLMFFNSQLHELPSPENICKIFS